VTTRFGIVLLGPPKIGVKLHRRIEPDKMVDRWSSRCRGSMGVHLLVHLAIVFGCAMLILCPAADAAAAASATKAKAKAASRTPSLPHVPLQFRAKARLFLLEEDEPYLVLYHHDSVAQRTREDFYSKIDGRHHRVYTSIRYLDKVRRALSTVSSDEGR